MKKIIRILAVIALISVLFASIFVAFESVHECTGSDCDICAIIANFRKIFEYSFSFVAVAGALNFLLLFVDKISRLINISFLTPVSLFDKLSD